MSGRSGWMAAGRVWRSRPISSSTSVMAAVGTRASRRGRLSVRGVAMASHHTRWRRADGGSATEDAREQRPGGNEIPHDAEGEIEQLRSAREPMRREVAEPAVAHDELQDLGEPALGREGRAAGMLVAG